MNASKIITVSASNLKRGDVCTGSGLIIRETFSDGLYEHNIDGSFIEPRRRFPKGKVEVWVSKTENEPARRDLWNARTAIQVARS